MDKDRSIYVALIFLVAGILAVCDIYYYNYDIIYKLNMSTPWIEQRLIKFNGTILFKHPIVTRGFIIILFTIAIFISKVKMKITEEKTERRNLYPLGIFSIFIYLFTYYIYRIFGFGYGTFISYLFFTIFGIGCIIYFISEIHKLFYTDLLKDRFNKKSRQFEQHKELLENEFSVNIKTEDGWINIVNPFRASQVLGTPGSGKSYAFIIEAIIQMISKGFTMLIYDYKFPDLALIAYNALQKNKANYPKKPEFCIINFDDLTRTNRCNPLQPNLLNDSTDAMASAQALMYGLYPKWAQKQGEFFTESSINFVAACIWALKQIDEGKYCSVPHLVQFIGLDYDILFTILRSVEDEFVKNVIQPFISALDKEATDQLEGQIGTTRIALSRLTSPYVYYVMTDDFQSRTKKDENGNFITVKNFQGKDEPVKEYYSPSGNSISLQINDPEYPKILCLSNNPDKQSVYSPLLSLYNTRLMRLVNKKKMQKCGMILDELPTLSFPPGTIDNLIATARSNKIAVFLGYQDFAQLVRDLGKEIADAIINTVGNTFSGMVNFDTAKKLSEKFGKIKIKKESVTVSKENTSVNINTEMAEIIPPSEISSLAQGTFVGQVADDRGAEIEQKVFYSKILIDHEKRKEYEQGSIPPFVKFDKPIDQIVSENFQRIREDIERMAEVYRSIIEEQKE